MSHASTGICGSCQQCRSDFNIEITIDQFTYHEWNERDRLHIELRHDDTDTTLVEFWDDDARQFCDEWEVCPHQYPIERALRDYADEIDAIDSLDGKQVDVIIDSMVSREDVIDEGGFYKSSCELCGDHCPGNRYAAHNVESDGKIYHYDVCEDCVQLINDIGGNIIDVLNDHFSEFWSGYLIGLAFTAHAGAEMDEHVEDWHLPGQDIADCLDAQDVEEQIGEDNARELRADCIDFLAANLHLMRPDVATLRAALLQWGIDHPGQLDECPDDIDDDDIEELALEIGLIRSMDDLGSDFHFTRNSHGVGFWDRAPLLFADELTRAAEVYSSCELWQLETGEFEIVN